MDRAQRDRHYAWRRRVARNLPDLCARVFALRGKPYAGSGVHYSMEHALGTVMRLVNDYSSRLDVANVIIDEVIVEELYRTIVKAEMSLTTVSPPV